jgi:hypothetical protein
MVVLGLVTTKRGDLESKDDLIRRIEEASRHVPSSSSASPPSAASPPPSRATPSPASSRPPSSASSSRRPKRCGDRAAPRENAPGRIDGPGARG